MGEAQLRPDMRSVLLNVAYDTFGKGGGMTKACIAKVFKAAKQQPDPLRSRRHQHWDAREERTNQNGDD